MNTLKILTIKSIILAHKFGDLMHYLKLLKKIFLLGIFALFFNCDAIATCEAPKIEPMNCSDSYLINFILPQVVIPFNGVDPVIRISDAVKELVKLKRVNTRFYKLLTNENIRKILIHAGFNLDIVNTGNPFPLYEAARLGDSPMVTALIIAGVDINKQANKPGNIIHKKTALHTAVLSGHLAIIEQLILAGANVSIADAFGHIPEQYTSSQLVLNVLRQAPQN